MLESIRIGTILLSAFLPDCSEKVLKALSVEKRKFEDAKEFYGLETGKVVEELGILFPRIDPAKEFEELAKLNEDKK